MKYFGKLKKTVMRWLRRASGDGHQEPSSLSPQILDVGWPELHAPPLDKVCTICKAQEAWLNSDPQHVVVIHCRVSTCSGAQGAHLFTLTSSFLRGLWLGFHTYSKGVCVAGESHPVSQSVASECIGWRSLNA